MMMNFIIDSYLIAWHTCFANQEELRWGLLSLFNPFTPDLKKYILPTF